MSGEIWQGPDGMWHVQGSIYRGQLVSYPTRRDAEEAVRRGAHLGADDDKGWRGYRSERRDQG